MFFQIDGGHLRAGEVIKAREPIQIYTFYTPQKLYFSWRSTGQTGGARILVIVIPDAGPSLAQPPGRHLSGCPTADKFGNCTLSTSDSSTAFSKNKPS